MRLKNKIALVTGSSRGIGRKIVELFIAEGAFVFINYLNSIDQATQLLQQLTQKYGDCCRSIRCDVSDSKQVREMVDRIKAETGRVDILVNNAGITRRGKLLELSENDWDDVIDINLKGAFLCCQFVTPLMLENNYGVIVNISSVRGVVGSEKSLSYAVSKGGLNILTRCLAIELAPFIRVNGVAPGYTLTDIHQNKTADELKRISDRIAMKRFATPDEIAKTVLFLSSDESSYITGETILTSGGFINYSN